MATFNGFNIRTEYINLFNGLSKNKLFWKIAIGIIVGTMILCTVAGDLISVTALGVTQWIAIAVLSLLVIPVDMLRKVITN